MYKFEEFNRLDEEERKRLTGGVWKRMRSGGMIYVDHDGNILAGGNKSLHDKISKIKKDLWLAHPEKVEIDDIIANKTSDITQLVLHDKISELRKDYPTISESVLKVSEERQKLLDNIESSKMPEWSKKNEIAKAEREFSRKMGWLARADSYNDIANEINKGVADISSVIKNELGNAANEKIMQLINSINNSINLPSTDTQENNWVQNNLSDKVLSLVKELLKENPMSEIDDNPYIKK
ncbi:MAG: hypothetical protein PHC28_16310 [Flavobacterium sp.]|uniref:hypothetical protein n=1 Tax=Flavobacterium sp. TaxID=239 RepID=UPI0026045019|nr:hypothetical protein [Flavobacterium sp.]MDD5152017.1 hypothetical protein [Flavobacterium sp.]